jgi:MYXO-CTERM domain-containing protein
VRPLRAIADVIWELVVGDDWRTAAGVVAAIALTALASASGSAGWWVLALAVVVLLVLGIRRALDSAAGGPNGG